MIKKHFNIIYYKILFYDECLFVNNTLIFDNLLNQEKFISFINKLNTILIDNGKNIY